MPLERENMNVCGQSRLRWLAAPADHTVTISIFAIFIVSLISFAICNIYFSIEHLQYFSVFEWVWCPVAIILTLLVSCAAYTLRRYSAGLPLIVGFLLSNIAYFYFVFSYDTTPCSDWYEVWKTACQMANGHFAGGLIPGSYMHEIPYQLGLAYVESLFIRLFGESYLVLQIFNIILLNILGLFVYHFAKRKASSGVACVAYMLACVFLCWSMTVAQFTNHHLGIIFIYLTLYFGEKQKYVYSVAAGISLALLNFVRPMGIIVVMALVCVSIYKLLTLEKVRKTVLNLATVMATYFLCLFLLDSYMIDQGYIDVKISQSSRNMYHKITYGLYESKVDGTRAQYASDEDYDAAFRRELVTQLQQNPRQITLNVAKKMCRYLGLFDYGFEMSYNHDESVWTKYPVKSFYCTQWFQYVIYIILAIYGYYTYRKKHPPDVYQIFFIGNTFVYIFVEAFTSYRFENYFYMLFLAGYGIHELVRKFDRQPAEQLPENTIRGRVRGACD